jgi:hypothetical protein
VLIGPPRFEQQRRRRVPGRGTASRRMATGRIHMPQSRRAPGSLGWAPWCGRARQALSRPAVTRSPASGLPGPEGAKPLPMPTNHCLGANDVERLAPPGPPLGEPYPERAIEAPEPRPLRVMAEQGELLPERQVLKREIGAGSERSTRGSQESEYEGHCAQRRSASSRRPVSRSSFGNDKFLKPFGHDSGCACGEVGRPHTAGEHDRMASVGLLPRRPFCWHASSRQRPSSG